MLTRLVERFDPDEFRVREDTDPENTDGLSCDAGDPLGE
jgi:hypothetical protein